MSQGKSTLSLKVFGGIFAMAGLVILLALVVRPIGQSIAMLTWHSAPAQLTSTSVDSHQSRDSDGNWQTYYSAKVEYQYQYGGQSYWGNRLNISEFSSTNSDKAYQRLYDLRADFGNQLTVWVNPQSPTQSIIYRSPQWRLMISLASFSAVFIIVGWLIMGSGRKKAQPEQLVSDEQQKLVLLKRAALIAAVAGSIPGGFLLFAGWWQTFFALLAYSPAIVLALVYYAKQRAWQVYQTVPLQLNNDVGVIGGDLKGHLDLPGAPITGEQYAATLRCLKKTTRRSSNKTEESITEQWSKWQRAKVEPIGMYSRVSFNFELPAHLPESEPESANHYFWQLQVRCTRKGPNFNRDYVVPAHKTEASQTVADELREAPLTEADITSAAQQVDLVSDGQQISWHSKSDNTGLIFTAFGLVFAMIGLAIVLSSGAIMPWLFVLVGLVFAGIGTAIKGRNWKVRAEADRLEVEVYSFNKLKKRHVFNASGLPKIEWFEESRGSTNGVAHKAKFSLRLILNHGEALDIGGNFESAKAAEFMRQKLINVVTGE
ncbi:DUF3592 domain-containing protein [Salinibius halmophilus]|uniref:DUF3592 domain-containing protein n=1 Tax=Salinibius halmophilus TaxID=1853216 RepID=UPI000E65FDE6|nr:DUF3592 domain-containing protein [Salinibius halmophilus]